MLLYKKVKKQNKIFEFRFLCEGFFVFVMYCEVLHKHKLVIIFFF